ncbi:MAG TPA: hypothetical protein VEF90_07450 [Xanthobacteraceae bacterium]|nr:hypothetical protein [Xanthobacteraceae bacterium]
MLTNYRQGGHGVNAGRLGFYVGAHADACTTPSEWQQRDTNQAISAKFSFTG